MSAFSGFEGDTRDKSKGRLPGESGGKNFAVSKKMTAIPSRKSKSGQDLFSKSRKVEVYYKNQMAKTVSLTFMHEVVRESPAPATGLLKGRTPIRSRGAKASSVGLEKYKAGGRGLASFTFEAPPAPNFRVKHSLRPAPRFGLLPDFV